jgi:hypothetical protein
METMQCYSMATLDTIFIRMSHRRQGFATSALQDILTEFSGQSIGFSSPVSMPMMKGKSIYVQTHRSHLSSFQKSTELSLYFPSPDFQILNTIQKIMI